MQSKAIAKDPTAQTTFHRPDDRFLPLRPHDLLRALADDTERFGECAALLAPFGESLAEVIEQEVDGCGQRLRDEYDHFNPDRDTLPTGDEAKHRTPRGYAAFHRHIGFLFDKANFAKLSDVQIDDAVHTANTYGLRVKLDPSRVEELSLWVRGRTDIERKRSGWRAYVHGKKVTVASIRRLAVLVRLKDDPHIILKLFKDIPEEDVQALLPHAEVQMGLLDRLVVFGGGAGTVGSTAYKVIGAAGSIAALGKLFWVILMGLVTVTFRTFMGYRRARSNNDSQRTRHLYYQNLSNNAAVLYSLLRMIAHEEYKEAMLAYAFCFARNGGKIISTTALDEMIEAWIRERFDIGVDFDAADAVETLDRLNLWSNREAFEVIPPAEATQRLQEHWREKRSAGYYSELSGQAPNS